MRYFWPSQPVKTDSDPIPYTSVRIDPLPLDYMSVSVIKQKAVFAILYRRLTVQILGSLVKPYFKQLKSNNNRKKKYNNYHW